MNLTIHYVSFTLIFLPCLVNAICHKNNWYRVFVVVGWRVIKGNLCCASAQLILSIKKIKKNPVNIGFTKSGCKRVDRAALASAQQRQH